MRHCRTTCGWGTFILGFFTLAFSATLALAEGDFVGWCAYSDFPAEEEPLLAVLFYRAGLWGERSAEKCQTAHERLLLLQHLNLTRGPYDPSWELVRGLKGLTFFPHLMSLSLAKNDIPDVSALKSFHALRSLNLYQNNVRSVAPLREMTRLEQVILAANPIQDLQELGELRALRILDIAATGTKRLPQNIAQFSLLQEIYLADNELIDLAPLGQISRLSYINAAHNQLKNLDDIRQLAQLNFLDVGYNNLKTLGDLSQWKKLSVLDVRENHLKDIDALVGQRDLRYLNIAGNCIERIPPELEKFTAPHQNSVGEMISLNIVGRDEQRSCD